MQLHALLRRVVLPLDLLDLLDPAGRQEGLVVEFIPHHAPERRNVHAAFEAFDPPGVLFRTTFLYINAACPVRNTHGAGNAVARAILLFRHLKNGAEEDHVRMYRLGIRDRLWLHDLEVVAEQELRPLTFEGRLPHRKPCLAERHGLHRIRRTERDPACKIRVRIFGDRRILRRAHALFSLCHRAGAVLCLCLGENLRTVFFPPAFMALCRNGVRLDLHLAQNAVAALENTREQTLRVRVLDEHHAVLKKRKGDMKDPTVVPIARVIEKAVCHRTAERRLGRDLGEPLDRKFLGGKVRKDAKGGRRRILAIECETFVRDFIEKLGVDMLVKIEEHLDPPRLLFPRISAQTGTRKDGAFLLLRSVASENIKKNLFCFHAFIPSVFCFVFGDIGLSPPSVACFAFGGIGCPCRSSLFRFRRHRLFTPPWFVSSSAAQVIPAVRKFRYFTAP